jgi:hypothetical protein
MGKKVTRKTKEEVIREWIQGLRRDKIAKYNGLGDGTVTGIIKEASKLDEYHNMALFRHLALVLNQNNLEPFNIAFAIRLMKIMEQNDINEDQIEPIISDFTTYCYKQNLPFEDFVQSARECLNLANKFRIHGQEIPEYIAQGKKMIDNLEEQRQDLLREKQRVREERDALTSEIKKYGKEKQLIKQNEELKRELNKSRQLIVNCKEQSGLVKQQIVNERRASRALDGLNADLLRDLSFRQEELEKCKKRISSTGLRLR